MGKRSVRENKNIYQLSREEAGLTREKASELMEVLSSDRIEKIESERSLPHPDEILVMANCYKKPNLCNYFCSHECQIGKRYVSPVEEKDFAQIVLEFLALQNSIGKYKDRLIEIASNGRINDDEYEDFVLIQSKMENLSRTVNELRVWLDGMIMNGIVDQAEIIKWKNKEDRE